MLTGWLSKPRRTVGVDRGSFQTKIVALEKIDGVIRLVGWKVLPTPADSRQLSPMLNELGVPRARWQVAVGGSEVSVRFLQFPPLRAEEVFRAIPFELAKYLPYPPQEAAWDFQIISPAGAKNTRVVVAAVRRTWLQEELASARQWLPEIELVDVQTFALANAFFFNYAQIPGECSLLVEAGHQLTRLVAMVKGELVMVREYASGHPETDLAGVGAPTPSSSTTQAGAMVPENWTRPIESAIHYVENQTARHVDGVYLSGGLALSEGVLDGIARAVSIPVQRLDPLRRVTVRDELKLPVGERGLLGVAVGLALRNLVHA